MRTFIWSLSARLAMPQASSRRLATARTCCLYSFTYAAAFLKIKLRVALAAFLASAAAADFSAAHASARRARFAWSSGTGAILSAYFRDEKRTGQHAAACFEAPGSTGELGGRRAKAHEAGKLRLDMMKS